MPELMLLKLELATRVMGWWATPLTVQAGGPKYQCQLGGRSQLWVGM